MNFTLSGEEASAPRHAGEPKGLGAVFFCLALLFSTVAAYWPALKGGHVWDDESWTEDIAHLFHDWRGLLRMWTCPTALQQYFPVTGTTFWLDAQLWGGRVFPAHLENVLLHAVAAVLFWRLLAGLGVPGAWLAASVFALHPAMAESVAWLTERKNVLSLVFLLSGLLAYARHTAFWSAAPVARHCGWWWLALGFFVLAMLSKVTAFCLPPLLLLLAWWKRGAWHWRRELPPVLPFFFVATALGALVAWLETNHVGAEGAEWSWTFLERVLIAGRALWFYVEKLLWPARLCPIYPAWTLDIRSWWQWLYPASAVLVTACLWKARHRVGRGTLAALLFYVVALSPTLGFLNMYGMRYSFVSHRWAYVPLMGLIALGVGGLAGLARRTGRSHLLLLAAALVLPALAFLTWGQASVYRNADSFWSAVFRENPLCWVGHYNVGNDRMHSGQMEEAVAEYERALALVPQHVKALTNLGKALGSLGRTEEAVACYRKALEIEPAFPAANFNLGNSLLRSGDLDGAGVCFSKAVEADPAFTQARDNLAFVLLQQGRLDDAIMHYRQIIQLRPRHAPALGNLGVALRLAGRIQDAVAQYREALEINPDDPTTLCNYAWILATHPDAMVRDGDRAVALAERARVVPGGVEMETLKTLAAAYAETGRYAEALQCAQEALESATRGGDHGAAQVVRLQIQSYYSRKPWRETGIVNPPR